MNRRMKIFVISILGGLVLSSCGTNPGDFSNYIFHIDDNLSSIRDSSSSTSYRNPTNVSQTSFPTPNYPGTDSLPTSLPKEEPYKDPEEIDYSNPKNVTYSVTDIKKGRKPTDYKVVAKDDSYYLSKAIELAAEEIASFGYDVFKAYAIVELPEEDEENEENKLCYIPGLGFTEDKVYSDEDDFLVYSCGFIQIMEAGQEYDDKQVLTEEMVSQGVMVLSNEPDGKHYVIESNVILDGYAGISDDRYFSYKQTSAFTLEVSVKDNLKSNYDDTIDIYSYDEDKYIFRKEIFEPKEKLNAFAIYGDRAAKSYRMALDAVEQLIALQDSNGINIALSSLVIIDNNILDQLALTSGRESINGMLETYLQNVHLEENQYLKITSNGGVEVETDYSYKASQERAANGIINTLSSLAMVAGGFTILSFSLMGGPVLAAISIGLSTGVLTYAGSNLIQGTEDIIHGTNYDMSTDSDDSNPVMNIFRECLGDDTGKKAYHAWGLISAFAGSLINPVQAGLTVANGFKMNVFQTAIQVGRAVVTHLCKAAITAGAGAIVGNFTNKTISKFTDNPFVTKLGTATVTFLTAFLTYRVVDSIDHKLNISGTKTIYNPKDEIDEFKKKNGIGDDTKTVKKKLPRNVTGDTDDDIGMHNVLEKNYYSTEKVNQRAIMENDFSKLAQENKLSYETKLVMFDPEEGLWQPLMELKRYQRNIFFEYAEDKVEEEELPTGFYDPYTKTIYLSDKLISENGELALYTLAHLLRHAYQFENAEFNSQMLKSLRDTNYSTSRANLAEIDANNYADYILTRAKNTLTMLQENPDIRSVINTLVFNDPNTFLNEK